MHLCAGFPEPLLVVHVLTQISFSEYAEELDSKRPYGRVSHVAVAAYGNILLVAGGFSGYVRGDLIAFKFPSYVAPPQVSFQDNPISSSPPPANFLCVGWGGGGVYCFHIRPSVCPYAMLVFS